MLKKKEGKASVRQMGRSKEEVRKMKDSLLREYFSLSSAGVSTIREHVGKDAKLNENESLDDFCISATTKIEMTTQDLPKTYFGVRVFYYWAFEGSGPSPGF